MSDANIQFTPKVTGSIEKTPRGLLLTLGSTSSKKKSLPKWMPNKWVMITLAPVALYIAYQVYATWKDFTFAAFLMVGAVCVFGFITLIGNAEITAYRYRKILFDDEGVTMIEPPNEKRMWKNYKYFAITTALQPHISDENLKLPRVQIFHKESVQHPERPPQFAFGFHIPMEAREQVIAFLNSKLVKCEEVTEL